MRTADSLHSVVLVIGYFFVAVFFSQVISSELLLEVLYCLLDSGLQLNPRFPVKNPLREGNIGSPPAGVILDGILVDDLTVAPHLGLNDRRKL